MEGQTEFSIIKLSELDCIKLRLDSEFYQRKYLQLQDRLAQFGSISLKDAGALLDCSAFYPSITEEYNFEEIGIPFLRVNEIQDGLVKTTKDTVFLPQHILENNPTTIATALPNDIIIAKGGNTLAKLGLLPTDFSKYALSRDLIVMRTAGMKRNKYFVWLFLHSKFGQDLLWRTASQTGQPHLTLPSIEQLAIPEFSEKFEATAETLYERSVWLKSQASTAYKVAETLLLDTLGMAHFSASTEVINIKSFKDSFAATGRLDAEYYQPKYEDYQAHVLAYPHGWMPLAQVCNLQDENYSPSDATTYQYIELADIDNAGGITGCTEALGSELPSRARRKVQTDDVLISSIEGSLSSCAIVTEKMNAALCSTGFYVINSDKINSETLLVLFKSPLMQNLLKQSCSGTILTAINKTEFQNIPVPLVEQNAQAKITALVQESFTLKAESARLLEVAKRAVEIAIEQDEAEGMRYIAENMQTTTAGE